MKKGRLNVVIDGQWGSTGKGKLCDWLLRKHDVAVAVCDFQTNAGHTVVLDNGQKFVLQQLPVAALIPDVVLLVNPGATITVAKLLEEIETHGVQNRVHIHPHAAVVTAEAIEFERENLNRISSTLKGCGATLGMKAMRHPRVVLAKDVPELKPWVYDTTELLHNFLKMNSICMAESAQGLDLSINHGHLYPYTTSRDITTASVLSNAGVPPHLIGDVWGCVRTFPIRVGHAFDKDGGKIGDSGPFYEDQIEMSWEEMTNLAKAPAPLEEKTTVTGKVRRVFTFSRRQYNKFLQICGPTHIFLNFVNYLDWEAADKRTWSEMPEVVRDFVSDLNADGVPVAALGTGPKTSDVVELM